jgi:hypothetical protein
MPVSLAFRSRTSTTCASEPYLKQRRVWRGTRSSPVAIGVRKAPAPQGLPGYIRIDTGHQGDQDGMKGVYQRSQFVLRRHSPNLVSL